MSHDVSKSLHTWLVSEMGYSEGDITTDNLRSICKGPMVDIWLHVMRSVKSRESVLKIQKNLAIHEKNITSKTDPKRLELLQRRKRLEADVEELQKAVILLQEENVEEKKLFTKQEQELVALNHKLRDTKRTIYLLKLEYQNLQHRMAEHQTKHNELIDLLKLFSGALGDQYSDVSHEVNQICNDMVNFLDALMSSEDLSTPFLKERKIEFGASVSNLVISHQRSAIGRSLIQLQEESITELQSKINYPTAFDEKSVDTEPLQKLLQKLCWTYVHLQTASKKAQKEAQLLEQQLELQQKTVEETLRDGSQFKADTLNAAASLVEVRLQLARRKAAVEYLKKAADELEVICQENQKKQLDIEAKMCEIENNRAKAAHLANFICTLVRRNGKALELIEEARSKARTRAKNELKTKYESLSGFLKAAVTSNGQQAQQLGNLRPSQFFQVKVNGILVSLDQLCINRLLPLSLEAEDIARGNLYSAINILELEPTLPVHVILRAVVAKYEELVRVQLTIRLRESYYKGKTLNNKWMEDSLAVYSELKKEVDEKRSRKEKELIPILDSRISKFSSAYSALRELKTLYEDWWTEPAQFADTGVRLDEKTISQWREEWSRCFAAIRKIKK